MYLAVGIGGMIGAVLRYVISWGFDAWQIASFPIGTFIINLLGCFILGWFTTYLAKLNKFPPFVLTGFSTGLIGSFTTFSTFSYETAHFIQLSLWGLAVLYVLCSLWGGLLFSFLGFRLGEKWFHNRMNSSDREGGFK